MRVMEKRFAQADVEWIGWQPETPRDSQLEFPCRT